MARSTATSINLLAQDGTLTDLGRLYATLAPGSCSPWANMLVPDADLG
jgi:hypothetical protein